MSQKILNKILIFFICILPLIYFPFNFFKISNLLVRTCLIYICSAVIIFLCFILNYKKLDKTDIFLVAFYLLNVLSLCFSMNPKFSIFGMTSSMRYDGIIMLGAYLLIYYASKYYFKINKIDIPLFFSSGTIVCLFGIYQFATFTQSNSSLNFTESVLRSTLGNSNFVGSYLTLFIPALITIYFLKGNLRYLLLSIIFLSTLVLSTARSAWIGIAVFSIFLIIFLIKNFEKKQIKNYIFILVCFIIICILAVCFEQITGNHIISHKFYNLIQDVSNMAQGKISLEMGTARIKIWSMVFDVIKNRPLLGTGPEALSIGLAKYSPKMLFQWFQESNTFIDKAHNDYLHIAACTGIPSLVIYLAFLISALKKNIKNMFKSKISFIFFGTIIAYLIQAFFNISVISVAPIFWFVLGISQNEYVKNKLEEIYFTTSQPAELCIKNKE